MRYLFDGDYSKSQLPALFLDRDGIINIDHGHVYKISDFEFNDEIFNLVREAKKNNFLVIVITNQAGIAKGFYTEEDFKKLSHWMLKIFLEKNAKIDAIYYSPFHPTMGKGKYLLKENTRKPGAGMIVEAMQDFNINISKSILVGDKISDIQAGIAANVEHNFLYKNSDDLSKRFSDRTIRKLIKKIESLNDVHPFLNK